jgi:hypothetical protein
MEFIRYRDNFKFTFTTTTYIFLFCILFESIFGAASFILLMLTL